MSFFDHLKTLVVAVEPIGLAVATTAVKSVNPIAGMALDAVLKAEMLPATTNADKKGIVMQSVLTTAKLNGIELNVGQMSSLVDNLVEALNKSK